MRTPTPGRRLACALHGATVAHHTGPTPTVNDVIGATRGLYRIEITEDEAQAALGLAADQRDARAAASTVPGYGDTDHYQAI